jgi:hypothetical protein
LEFSSASLNFGMFERTTRPSLPVTIKNVGTVKTSFNVKDPSRPTMFHVTPSKGLLLPGKSAEIIITHMKHEVEDFEEKVIIKTDLIDKIYSIKIRGQCEETILHSEEFSLLNLGVCPVLEATSKPMSFKNYGKYPLEYNIKAAYPLKITPSSGVVAGETEETVTVSWVPSGGYELRTQVIMVTNIGNFNIVIRAKAAFPELFIDNMYIDYGVCGTGSLYVKTFQILNRGKTPLKFTIPELKEPVFKVSTNEGVLQPKESCDVEVIFTPNAIGRFLSSAIVECKGIHYKEVVLVGVGGILKFDIKPTSIDLGKL